MMTVATRPLLRLLLLLATHPLVASSDSLDASRFAQVMSASSAERWLVLFHSPSCGHCAAMMPAWHSAAAATTTTNAKFALVDATAEQELAQQFKVNGYPTLLSIEPDGAVYEFDGERTVESIVSFADRATTGLLGGLLQRRRGYYDRQAGGSVRPSSLDALLQAPREAGEIVQFAMQTSPPGATLLVLLLVLVGCAIAIFSTPSSPPQFIYVICPEGKKPGEGFNVEFPVRRPSRIIPFRRVTRKRVITVQAPPGIAPGQTFFVPLMSAPTARAVGAGMPATSQSKKAD